MRVVAQNLSPELTLIEKVKYLYNCLMQAINSEAKVAIGHLTQQCLIILRGSIF